MHGKQQLAIAFRSNWSDFEKYCTLIIPLKKTGYYMMYLTYYNFTEATCLVL